MPSVETDIPAQTPDSPADAYWRSLDQLAGTPEFRAFVEKEFPNYNPDEITAPTRRSFMKVMGASMALAGLTGCRRWPERHLAPYTRNHEAQTPGVALHYATSMELAGVARPLLVKSYDGRPIKIEGNPSHPASLGAADAFAQASVLSLYDPDRSRTVRAREGAASADKTWGDFIQAWEKLLPGLKEKKGAGVAVLCEATNSPSVRDMARRLNETLGGQVKWYTYEPVDKSAIVEGIKSVIGKPARALLNLDAADVVVCFDADILSTSHPDSIRNARGFAAKRRAADEGRMSRIYVAESCFSLTGSMADNRLALKSGDIPALVDEIHRKVAEKIESHLKSDSALFVDLLVEDLLAKRGASVLVAGPSQPASVHAAIAKINGLLGNIGKTIHYIEHSDLGESGVAGLRELTTAMAGGSIDTLIILGGNPVYNAPGDLGFAQALAKVKTSVHLSEYPDETSAAVNWHLPRAHYLEAWGDARTFDGTVSLVQPLILPLWGGKSIIETLALLSGEKSMGGQEIVKRTFGPGTGWKRALHDGFVDGSATKPLDVAGSDFKPVGAPVSKSAADALEVVFQPDYSVYDGRYANNAWLQELPDPMTKLTWDNAAFIGVATAKQLGIRHGDLITITSGSQKLEIAACVTPGQAKNSISISLGYGRAAAGGVGGKPGVTSVGFDAYRLRGSGSMWIASSVQVARSGGKYRLVSVSDHFAIDDVGKETTHHRAHQMIREANLATYHANPKFAKYHGHHDPKAPTQLAPYPKTDETAYKWGMSIDLNTCTGCSACVIACQAENNVPVVGKEQVQMNREMHWLRIDRYYKLPESESGRILQDDAFDSPMASHQPLACHHCENAPCEQVCPVAATMHDSEGLNVMVYNRCIGTRYCSNNCPYKVRRFNYFDFHAKDPQKGPASAMHLNIPDTQPTLTIHGVKKMMYNPDVTVRMRGVMEKCTYCIQRIKAATIPAKNEGRVVKDGEIVPACVQTCPTQAIVFGNLKDTQSKAHQMHAHQRSFAMLESAELDERPRTLYLAKIRNPAGPQGKVRKIEAAEPAHKDVKDHPAKH